MIIIYILYILVSALISLGVLKGVLSFGLGLGDLGMLGALLFSLIIVSFGFYFRGFIGSKINFWNSLIVLFMITSLIYFALSITVCRGNENPWNGSLII